MATSFSNSGEDAIQRSIASEKLRQTVVEADDIGTVFEINKTAEWINENGFKKVGTNQTATTLSFFLFIIIKFLPFVFLHSAVVKVY